MTKKKITKLSATRISAFLQCKLRYWMTYNEKREKIDNPAFRFGLLCHETLEYAARLGLEDKVKVFSPEQLKEILNVYDKYSVDFSITDQVLRKEGKKYVKKCLSDIDCSKIIDIEQQFGFKDEFLTEKGVPIIGAIDRLDEDSKDTVIVVDYKTSKSVPQPDYLREDIQLSMYNLVVKKLYPQYKRRILSLYMLRKGESVYTYRNEEEELEFEEYLVMLHESMTNLKKKDATPSLGILCPWCDFRDRCDEFQARFKKEVTAGDPMVMSKEGLISEFLTMQALSKASELRSKELATIIIEGITTNNEEYDDGKQSLYIRQNSTKRVNSKKVLDLIPKKDIHQVATVNANKVLKYVSKNTAIKDQVMKQVSIGFTAPFLAKRKSKQK